MIKLAANSDSSSRPRGFRLPSAPGFGFVRLVVRLAEHSVDKEVVIASSKA
jgi:hypothetical protein